MNLGLLGCGNIAKGIVKAINEGNIHFRIASLFDIDVKKARRLVKEIEPEPKPKIANDFGDFLKEVDIVMEAASQDAVKEYAGKILSFGKILMIMSIGALVDEKFLKRLKDIAKENRTKIYLPSGAVLGIDGLKAAKIGKVREVTLTTRKSPGSLGVSVNGEKIIFNGTAKEAVRKFPKNINVAATVSLAGIGVERTRVKIIADPKVEKNIHEIRAVGEFGEFQTIAKNVPSLENPSTSYLAVLSAIGTLKKIERDELEIGT